MVRECSEWAVSKHHDETVGDDGYAYCLQHDDNFMSVHVCLNLSNWPFMYFQFAAAAAKSLQSCLTLCDPIDSSPPGSSVPGISRQEHWSGFPFPSPVHESEKWK